MFQIAAVGLICAVLSLAVRSWRPEFSIYISAASGLVLFAMVYSQLEGIISGVSGLFQKPAGAGVYFPVLLKVIGIAYLTDFSAQVCRDAGKMASPPRWRWRERFLSFTRLCRYLRR